MKKIFACLLVFALVFTSSVTTFAENTAGKDEPKKFVVTEPREIDPSEDINSWNTLGTVEPLAQYYVDASSDEEVRQNINDAVASLVYYKDRYGNYGYDSIRPYYNVSLTKEGNWEIFFYHRAGDVHTRNSILQIFKYFLGKENGESMWKLDESTGFGGGLKPVDLGIEDIDCYEEGEEGYKDFGGTLVFADGASVKYKFIWTGLRMYTFIV